MRMAKVMLIGFLAVVLLLTLGGCQDGRSGDRSGNDHSDHSGHSH